MAGVRKRLGSLLGPRGVTGAEGPAGLQGLPGFEAVPTAEGIAQNITLPGPARDALRTADKERLGTVSIRDFGSVADYGSGNTDNHAAITAAILAAPAGGKVIIPPGRHLVNSTIIVDKPVAIEGGVAGTFDSQRATELVFPSGVTGFHVKENAQAIRASGFRIAHLMLQSLATSAAGGHGIYITNGMGFIEDVKINSFGGHGIYLRAGSSVGGGNVNNCVLDTVRPYSNRGDGIRLEGNDAQMTKIIWADIVGNYGWGINNIGAATTRVLYPHFDQSYFASPGAIRDTSNSSSYIDLYCEGGGGDGSLGRKVLLEGDSVYAHVTFSQYGGGLVEDTTVGKSAVVEDRVKGRYYRQKTYGAFKTEYTVDLDQPGVGVVRHMVLPGNASTGTVVAMQLAPEWASFGVPLRVLSKTTALRPNAGTAGAGAMIYDSTLGKPIWSNGSVWRDAMGTAV